MFEVMGIVDESEDEILPEAIECKICDWQEGKIVTYKSLKEG